MLYPCRRDYNIRQFYREETYQLYMKAKAAFCKYLKEHNIKYHECLFDGDPCVAMLFNGYENCPDKVLESCVYFWKDCIEARVYYTETGAKWCRNSKHTNEIYRLMNFVNAKVWPQLEDRIEGTLYTSSHLSTIRYYITEDGHSDITSTTVIPTDYFIEAQLEFGDMITAMMPDIMNQLSPYIFMILLGKIEVEEAISGIRTNILMEV